MQWADWAPRYAAILEDFGWSREADEAARDELGRLLASKRPFPEDALRSMLRDRLVPVVGPAPGVEDFEPPPEGAWIATDGAARALGARGLHPPLVVTDLDGDVPTQAAWNRAGTVLVVHAHGHNREALRTWVPRFTGPVVGTTQAAPTERVANYGGFTDGDRAVHLAAHFGAGAVRLVGFDLQHPVAKPGQDPALKRKKLAWCARLLHEAGIKVLPSRGPCGADGPTHG